MSIDPSTSPPLFLIILFKNDTLYSRFESFAKVILSLPSNVTIVKEALNFTLVTSPWIPYSFSNAFILLYVSIFFTYDSSIFLPSSGVCPKSKPSTISSSFFRDKSHSSSKYPSLSSL